MYVRKFLLVMLLCGYVICSTAVAATTQTAIDNVLTEDRLKQDNSYDVVASKNLALFYPDHGHDDGGFFVDYDTGGNSGNDDTVNNNDDDNPVTIPQIDDDPNNEPNINDEPNEDFKDEPSIGETKPVYNPLLNNNFTVNNVLASNSINYYSVRNLGSVVSDRLDELVSADESVSNSVANGANSSVSDGGWAGAGGSKTESSGSYKNEATYYEVGYDQLIKTTDYEKQYLGFSLTYNRGSIKYNGMTGNGKERDETVALYVLSKYKHGQYLSLVGTVGLYCNSYDLWDPEGYNESAKNRTYGFSGTVGYGRKIYFNGGDWYLDPHVNVTYSYLADNKYSISNGVDVTNGGMSDLIGKVGVTCGKRFGWQNAGLAYLRCSWSHEFMGDYKTTMRYNDTGSRITVTGDIRESWFDYGAGVSYKLSENNVASIYVGKSTGGNCYKDWVWNVGFKWAF